MRLFPAALASLTIVITEAAASIGRLRELGSPEAGKYLADGLGRWPAAGSKRVRQSLESAITSLPVGGR